jgi:hypothetical protein
LTKGVQNLITLNPAGVFSMFWKCSAKTLSKLDQPTKDALHDCVKQAFEEELHASVSSNLLGVLEKGVTKHIISTVAKKFTVERGSETEVTTAEPVNTVN